MRCENVQLFACKALTRIIHRSRGASLGIPHRSTFASLTNTGSIRSETESTVITTTFAIHSRSGELSRIRTQSTQNRKNMTEMKPSTPAIDLTGKVAIVTGASRGIGEAICRCYAKHGAKVVLAARKIEGLENAVKKIRAEGGDALAVACHTGQEEQVKGLIEKAAAHYGKIDILVNNAATNPHFGPLLDVESRAWDKTFEVNAKGYFTMIREVVRHLTERGAPGSIINVSSIASLAPAIAQGVYGMTKAAVNSMTWTLAVELGGTGIRFKEDHPDPEAANLSGKTEYAFTFGFDILVGLRFP